MWKNFETTDIVGKRKIVDKIELVKRFWGTGVIDEELTLNKVESLLHDLKANNTGKIAGVYCLYKYKTREVLYVGESRDLKQRLKDQFVGVKDKKYGIQKYTRLFSSFVSKLSKAEKMTEKEYNKLFEKGESAKLKKYMTLYQSFIFQPDNHLRVLETIDHVEAWVLEQTLISFFRSIRQSKYNDQWEEMSG